MSQSGRPDPVQGYEGLLSHHVEAKERHTELHPEEFIPVGDRATGFSSPRNRSKDLGTHVWKGESPSYPIYGVIGRNPPGWINLHPLHRHPQWKSPDEERMLRCRRRKQNDDEWNCAPILCRRKDHKLPELRKRVTFSSDLEAKGFHPSEWERPEHPLYRTTNGEYGKLLSLSYTLASEPRMSRGRSDLQSPGVIMRNRSLNT